MQYSALFYFLLPGEVQHLLLSTQYITHVTCFFNFFNRILVFYYYFTVVLVQWLSAHITLRRYRLSIFIYLGAKLQKHWTVIKRVRRFQFHLLFAQICEVLRVVGISSSKMAILTKSSRSIWFLQLDCSSVSGKLCSRLMQGLKWRQQKATEKNRIKKVDYFKTLHFKRELILSLMQFFQG